MPIFIVFGVVERFEFIYPDNEQMLASGVLSYADPLSTSDAIAAINSLELGTEKPMLATFL